MPITKKRKIGNLGESIACKYLESIGYKVLERNYSKPYGEIDIISEKGSIMYFFEVKSVTRENVSQETYGYRASENLHNKKIGRLTRTVQVFLLERGLAGREYKISAIIVQIMSDSKRANVEIIENIA